MRNRLMAALLALAALTWVGCAGEESGTSSSDSTASTSQPADTTTTPSEDGTETLLVTLDVPAMV